MVGILEPLRPHGKLIIIGQLNNAVTLTPKHIFEQGEMTV